jgi:hypothetical protein
VFTNPPVLYQNVRSISSFALQFPALHAFSSAFPEPPDKHTEAQKASDRKNPEVGVLNFHGVPTSLSGFAQ